jgi:hypothetical protein
MANDNPHATQHASFQQRFSINAAPYVMVNHLSRIQYAESLERTLPTLLEDIPINLHGSMRFRHTDTSPLLS